MGETESLRNAMAVLLWRQTHAGGVTEEDIKQWHRELAGDFNNLRYAAAAVLPLPDRAALAALLGFTWQDVDDEKSAAEMCEHKASRLPIGTSLLERAQRHRDRAERIAALLPPRDA